MNYAAGRPLEPHNYWLPFIQGHEEDNNATETALRGDLNYDLDKSGWLDSLKVGVRYADRDQIVRYSTFNWTPIAASLNCNGPGFNIDNTTGGAYPTTGSCGGNTGHPDFKGYGAGIWGTDNFNSFYGSGVYANGPLVFLNKATLENFRSSSHRSVATTPTRRSLPLYTAICDRPGTDGCFLPSEIMHVEEKTEAAYAELHFGGDDKKWAGIGIKGNIGLRVVETHEQSIGSASYPTTTNLLALPACATPLGPNQVVNPSCYLTSDVLNFASGGARQTPTPRSTPTGCRGFNVRFQFDDKDFVRFGYSRALARPDFGLLRNFVQINSPYINSTPDSPYVVYNSPTAAHTAANVVGYNFVFNADAGNAALLPETADQFDLSFERYIGPSSSFTADAFYKKLSNSLGYANFNRTF